MTDTALFLSVIETADLLGVSDDTIYDLAARGELPCAEFGRRKMIPRRAVELVLERAMAGFDPDAFLVHLAAVADSSTVGASLASDVAGRIGSAVEGSTRTTGPRLARQPDHPTARSSSH